MRNLLTFNKSDMQTAKTIIAIATICIAVLCGCEKAVFVTSDTTDESQQSTGKDIINKDTTEINYLTVAEAQEATIGEVICVKGYIVASCTRSMKNADFMEPFEGSTAIILADEPVDLEYFQFESDEHLFPVCLTDYKDVRAALNLEDNPSLWNKQIFITGVKSRYMSCPGLKKVLQYQVAE